MTPSPQDWAAPFARSPYRLRFELGGETYGNLTEPIARFLQAFERARRLADATFDDDARLLAVVCMGSPKQFKRLYKLGFERKTRIAKWRAPWHFAPEDAAPAFWRSFDVSQPATGRDIVLWSAVAHEMPIEPAVAGDFRLIGSCKSVPVLMHIYDDRGADLIAPSPEGLEHIRNDFDDWILDYDRARIEAAFGS